MGSSSPGDSVPRSLYSARLRGCAVDIVHDWGVRGCGVRDVTCAVCRENGAHAREYCSAIVVLIALAAQCSLWEQEQAR